MLNRCEEKYWMKNEREIWSCTLTPVSSVSFHKVIGISLHADAHQLYMAIYNFTAQSLRSLSNLTLSIMGAGILCSAPQNQTNNLAATTSLSTSGPGRPPVIYHFSRGTNNLPVCVWLFTARVSCLFRLSRRNVRSRNGVSINKQLFL